MSAIGGSHAGGCHEDAAAAAVVADWWDEAASCCDGVGEEDIPEVSGSPLQHEDEDDQQELIKENEDVKHAQELFREYSLVLNGGGTLLTELSSPWTDEKHGWYLNLIEEAFVKRLYQQHYPWTNIWQHNKRTRAAATASHDFSRGFQEDVESNLSCANNNIHSLQEESSASDEEEDDDGSQNPTKRFKSADLENPGQDNQEGSTAVANGNDGNMNRRPEITASGSCRDPPRTHEDDDQVVPSLQGDKNGLRTPSADSSSSVASPASQERSGKKKKKKRYFC